MKKIALIVDTSDWILNNTSKYGGGSIVAHNVYQTLKTTDNDITIICLKNNIESADDNVKIISLGLPVGDPEIQNRLDSLLKDYDRVINFMIFTISDGTIIQSHSYAYRSKLANFLCYPIKKLIYKERIKHQKSLFNKQLNYAFAVSNAIKEDYTTNYGLKNIKVVYPACKKVYDSFNDNVNDILTFGVVANSSLNKSGHYCILILSIAKLLGLKFELKIIAPKYHKDIFMQFLINKLGLAKNATILPKQENMSTFYNSIDCVIMPSIHESFGLVPLESMSFCKTCLVSNTIGFTEIIDENSAFVFKRSSIFSFIKALFKVHNLFYKNKDRFNEIRKNGFEISKHYTWGNVANQLIN